MTPDTAIKVLQLAFAVYQSSNERGSVDPATIEGSVSPPWWPKNQEELIDDAAALGLLPEGVSAEEVKALIRDQARG